MTFSPSMVTVETTCTRRHFKVCPIGRAAWYLRIWRLSFILIHFKRKRFEDRLSGKEFLFSSCRSRSSSARSCTPSSPPCSSTRSWSRWWRRSRAEPGNSTAPKLASPENWCSTKWIRRETPAATTSYTQHKTHTRGRFHVFIPHPFRSRSRSILRTRTFYPKGSSKPLLRHDDRLKQ